MRCMLTRSLADRWAWARGFFRDCEGRQNCGNQTISGRKVGSHVGWWPWDYWLAWTLTTWLPDREKTDTWARLTLKPQSFVLEGVEQAICQQFRESMGFFLNKQAWKRHNVNINISDVHMNIHTYSLSDIYISLLSYIVFISWSNWQI